MVHARGAAAHGIFQSYGTAESVTRAGFLAPGVTTEVFCRFSTVLGPSGRRHSSGLRRTTRQLTRPTHQKKGLKR